MSVVNYNFSHHSVNETSRLQAAPTTYSLFMLAVAEQGELTAICMQFAHYTFANRLRITFCSSNYLRSMRRVCGQTTY